MLFKFSEYLSNNFASCKCVFNPSRANPTKRSNALKQFVGNSRRELFECVSLALKELIEKFSYENYLKKAQQQTEEKKRKMEKCFQLATCCSCKKQLVILKIHFF